MTRSLGWLLKEERLGKPEIFSLQRAWGNTAVAHKSKERMAWNQLSILLFYTRIRGHEIKLAGAVLKKRRHFFMQQARPVGLLAE